MSRALFLLVAKLLDLLEFLKLELLPLLVFAILGLAGYFAGAWASLMIALCLDVSGLRATIITLRKDSHYSTITQLISPAFYLASAARLPVAVPWRVLALAAYAGTYWLLNEYLVWLYRERRNGTTPLHWAVEAGDLEQLRRELLARPHPLLRDNLGRTPLDVARGRKDEASLAVLTEYTSEWLRSQEGDGETPPALWKRDHASFGNTSGPELVAELGSYSPEPKLHMAILRRNYWGARDLLGLVDLDEADSDGWTAVHEGVYIRSEAMVQELLLELGARTDVADLGGWTPLHLAAFLGYTNMVELLVRFRAPVDALDHRRRMPSDLAAAAGHDQIASRLLRTP